MLLHKYKSTGHLHKGPCLLAFNFLLLTFNRHKCINTKIVVYIIIKLLRLSISTAPLCAPISNTSYHWSCASLSSQYCFPQTVQRSLSSGSSSCFYCFSLFFEHVPGGALVSALVSYAVGNGLESSGGRSGL